MTDRRFAPSTLVSRPSTGFTLIELLVVVAVIGILAGLALAAMGGIQKRGARAKAESDIQAISAAIEEFHRDFGKYPEANSNALFRELVGASATINNIPGKIKVYFEPPPGIIGTNASGQNFFQDPWGTGYFFITSGAGMRNRGLFDLYSTAGGSDQTKFIRN
jgi:prepilin-type N-terminal cleavage/methylation domain-containing protein